MENDYFNGDVPLLIFEFFRIKIRVQPGTFFSLRICLYCIDMHMQHKTEKCIPFRSYNSRAVNELAELN